MVEMGTFHFVLGDMWDGIKDKVSKPDVQRIDVKTPSSFQTPPM